MKPLPYGADITLFYVRLYKINSTLRNWGPVTDISWGKARADDVSREAVFTEIQNVCAHDKQFTNRLSNFLSFFAIERYLEDNYRAFLKIL